MDDDFATTLRGDMPALRGVLTANAPLAALSWFKTGGPAEVLFAPTDEDDLAYFLGALDPGIPVLTIGLGSNLLIRDGGVAGVVIQLGKPFAGIAVDGVQITAGAAVPDVKLASGAAQAGIAGLAFLRGIPGSVGGALRMNGGAYGAETKDVFVSARGVDRAGAVHEYAAADMGFTYRHCAVADDVIFTRATFAGTVGDPETIRADMAAITQARAATQPVNTRTGGSTFKNPPGEKAWALVDRAGCRGLVHGDAQVSELHTNFLINRGAASAADLEELGEIVRARVLETSGVSLEWEIARVGMR
ncbi:UDP-N-acetylmuramate dehydrogenase [Beijerinckia sp. L45]|uniref:UDP-N-acetylmuramate dehydrogenase n=1 Tax=Beijerinckia sp. L45 TaxID=1641855 RepID=UPI00131D939C|nr:UDP-N-acetylmuramate dehydrogenase [Beijerinckia sp. L45]